MSYDPALEPDPAEWLKLKDGERMDRVLAYHRDLPTPSGNWYPRIHARIHVIVEDQLAQGLPEAKDALRRLIMEGLDRHGALHAVGSILVDVFGGGVVEVPRAERRKSLGRLGELSAVGWRSHLEKAFSGST